MPKEEDLQPPTKRPVGSSAVMAKENAFTQRTVDANYMKEREKKRAKGRANKESERSGMWASLKEVMGVKAEQNNERELGSNSIQVSVLLRVFDLSSDLFVGVRSPTGPCQYRDRHV